MLLGFSKQPVVSWNVYNNLLQTALRLCYHMIKLPSQSRANATMTSLTQLRFSYQLWEILHMNMNNSFHQHISHTCSIINYLCIIIWDIARKCCVEIELFRKLFNIQIVPKRCIHTRLIFHIIMCTSFWDTLYLQLPSISGALLLHLQPEYMPRRGHPLNMARKSSQIRFITFLKNYINMIIQFSHKFKAEVLVLLNYR
jgi:hypothetical protein